jgi:hypothetical protein
MRDGLLAIALIVAPIGASAQTAPGVPGIADNSFLLEEAYNQEAGVVQHIGFFNRDGSGGGWQFGFTQEWPLVSQKHQLSYTVPIERLGSTTGVGDIGLNYRYQLYNNDTLGLAVAPRITMILPTGSRARGLGTGVVGRQFNLPVSKTLGSRVVTHWNAGITFFPGTQNAVGDTASVVNLNLAQSFVFLLSPTVNLMLETVWNRDESVTGPDQTTGTKSLFISPGVRFALNFESGLQVVPGIAFPIGVGPSSGENSVVLYLSFEHFFKRP